VVTRSVLLVAVVALVGGCGGTPAPTAVPSTTSAAAPATGPATASTTTADLRSPTVIGIQSGRGDDGSFEIDAWFADLPIAAGTTVVVGVDADDSYPGTGDVLPHLDGMVSTAYLQDSTDQTVTVDGEVVASSEQGNVSQWVSWRYEGGLLRVYFIGDVAPVAGTVWVIATRDGVAGPGGVGGADAGYSCSIRGSSIPMASVPSDVPDPGVACRYP